MQRAGTALDPLIGELGLAGPLSLYRIRKNWETLFHGPIAEHTFPSSVNDSGVLQVVADSPVWVQQLGFMKSGLLLKLKGFGVRDIRFRLGAVRRNTPRPEEKPRRLSEEEIAFAEETASMVRDPELQRNILNAIRRSLSRKGAGGRIRGDAR